LVTSPHRGSTPRLAVYLACSRLYGGRGEETMKFTIKQFKVAKKIVADFYPFHGLAKKTIREMRNAVSNDPVHDLYDGWCGGDQHYTARERDCTPTSWRDHDRSRCMTCKIMNALRHICEIADDLTEGKLYYAICKDGKKIRVKKNYNCDIEKNITGILTTWRIYDDEYPNLTYEEWGYQEIERHIISFEEIHT